MQNKRQKSDTTIDMDTENIFNEFFANVGSRVGITLDKHLTGEQQTSITIKRCFGSLISINKLARTLPRKTTKALVEALVTPHLRYCLPAWAPVTEQNRQRLNKVVNFGVRIVTGKQNTESAQPGGSWDGQIFLNSSHHATRWPFIN